MLAENESRRLAALREYDILDTPREEDLDKITAMGARLFDAALTCVTLVDQEIFIFKSTFGTDARTLDRRPGFCDTAIQQEGVHCIEDATTDPLVWDHPLVCNEPFIKSYAGSPLVTSSGFAIGTLCIMDAKARVFTDSEKTLLKELAEFVMFHLDRKRQLAEVASEEEKRQNARKLESLGMLAGGIAHDFNNLLVGVLGNASLATRQIEKDSPAQDTLANIISAANQSRELTGQLLAYGGQRPTRPKPVDMVQLVDDMLPLLNSSIAAEIRLEVDTATSLPVVTGDPTQLRQVVLNLVINASDAYSRDDGNVSLRLIPTRIDAPDTVDDLAAGQYIRVEVEDSGCGMDADTMNSMFNPFFSTKVSGRGLGMSIVHQIIRSHGGQIRVESELGRGSKVCIFLPAEMHARPAKEVEPPPITRINKGKGTVLIVDDEELVMNMTASAVKSFGFDACIAPSGKQALEQLEHLAEVDALILDATLSGVNGKSTLDAIREYRPNLPVVVTSGHHLDEVACNFKDFEKLTFLHKPWTLEQLSMAIHDAVARQSPKAKRLSLQ